MRAAFDGQTRRATGGRRYEGSSARSPAAAGRTRVQLPLVVDGRRRRAVPRHRPRRWRRSGCNPRYVIEATRAAPVPGAGARSRSIVRRLHATCRRAWRRTCAGRATAPWPGRRAAPSRTSVPSSAAHCSLALYGGGLGVLAGDTLKAASDLAVPMVGVGLLYRAGILPSAARSRRLATRVLDRHRLRAPAGGARDRARTSGRSPSS